jgi:hypothetical protein
VRTDVFEYINNITPMSKLSNNTIQHGYIS